MPNHQPLIAAAVLGGDLLGSQRQTALLGHPRPRGKGAPGYSEWAMHMQLVQAVREVL
jgi:hypothetical protein